jgi:hypothetical protein
MPEPQCSDLAREDAQANGTVRLRVERIEPAPSGGDRHRLKIGINVARSASAPSWVAPRRLEPLRRGRSS